MHLSIECEQEADGRWLAEVPQLPGVLAYGANADEAMAKIEVLALRVVAERLEHGEARPEAIILSISAATWPSAKAECVLAAASARLER